MTAFTACLYAYATAVFAAASWVVLTAGNTFAASMLLCATGMFAVTGVMVVCGDDGGL
jgi:hypothetical protein